MFENTAFSWMACSWVCASCLMSQAHSFSARGTFNFNSTFRQSRFYCCTLSTLDTLSPWPFALLGSMHTNRLFIINSRWTNKYSRLHSSLYFHWTLLFDSFLGNTFVKFGKNNRLLHYCPQFHNKKTNFELIWFRMILNHWISQFIDIFQSYTFIIGWTKPSERPTRK